MKIAKLCFFIKTTFLSVLRDIRNAEKWGLSARFSKFLHKASHNDRVYVDF